MEFHPGDPVMHWTHGFGHVVGVEERVLFDHKSLYYAVSIRDLIVWVPVDDKVDLRLRPPSSTAEFKRLFSILKGKAEQLPEDRQERKLHLVEKLRDGRAASLCRVLRDLATFQQSRTLNDNDLTVMKRSREALLSEWSHVLSIPPVEAETQLRLMLAPAPADNPKAKGRG